MRRSYALFDFDGTLIRGDSIIRFCFYAFRKRLIGVGGLARCGALGLLYGLKLISAEASKQGALRFLKGKTRREVDEIARDFCAEALIPNLYPQGLKEIRKHQQNGTKVWLVSASTSFYLEPLKDALGLDQLIATRMHVDENGVYTGLLDGHNCRGVEKTLRIAEVLAANGEDVEYSDSWAYGDSRGDVPMLMLCEHKMAVNPKKKLLKALQKADGVQIIRWKKKPE